MKGDSGGPLICRSQHGRFELTGVISWSTGCAVKNSPDVFSSVRYFLNWISQNTNIGLFQSKTSKKCFIIIDVQLVCFYKDHSL